MRKDFGTKTWFYPQPVMIIAAYDENGEANAMNAAWGGVYANDKVMLRINHGHKTTQNIIARGAFTVAFADVDNVVASDYVGIVSGNDEPQKMAKSGFHLTKSAHVDAPLIEELPVAMECTLVKVNEDGNIIGKIENVSVDERVLDADGNLDFTKFRPISFEPANADYRVLGEKVADAFQIGAQLK